MTEENKESPVEDASALIDPLAILFRLSLAAVSAQQTDSKFFAADVGVYRGRSLGLFLAEAAELDLDIEWYGIDTFSGLLPLSDKDRQLAPENAPYLSRPMFQDTTKREVEAFLEPLEMSEKYSLIEGQIQDVSNELKANKYIFVNLSIKTYDGHIQALKYFYRRIQPKGVISLDDYFNRRFPMAREAIDSFLKDKPEEVLHLTALDEEGKLSRRAFILKS